MTANNHTKPLFIIGGTFDPIHFGHLRMAVEVQERFPEAEVAFLPCGQPGHREPPIATAWQRLAMVQRALEHFPGFTLLTDELDGPGPHYTVATATRLRQRYPNRAIVWVIGNDASGGIHRWRGAEQLPSLIHLLCCLRPNYPIPTAEGFNRVQCALLTTRPYGQMAWLELPALDISSTLIRERVKMGRNILGLAPESVCHYIEHYQIYRQTEPTGNQRN